MSNISSIRLSGTTYLLKDNNATKTVELTQAQYDALTTKDANTFYIITDAQGGDLSNYYTKSETSGSSQISTALDAKQDTLVSGTNIKTINSQSILGSGNIEIQGGGSTYTAGRGISISNDVISFSLPISGGTGASSLIGNSNANQATHMYTTAFGTSSTASGNYSFACGTGSTASGNISFACGEGTSATADDSFACGAFTRATGQRSFACGSLTSATTSSSFASGVRTLVTNIAEAGFGEYNNSVTGSTTFGDSGNVLMSVGNGNSTSTRHNAFEIRQNGDIYIADTNDTSTSNFYEKPMIKLQDALGGGSVTVDDALSSTSENPVANSAITDAVVVESFDITKYNGTTIPTIAKTDNITKVYISTNSSSSVWSIGLTAGDNNRYTSTSLRPFQSEENDYAKSYVLTDQGYSTTIVVEAKDGYWLWNVQFTWSTPLLNVKTFIRESGGNVNDVLVKSIQDVATIESELSTALNDKIDKSSIVTSISSSSTDAQIPSAKAVYDKLGGLSLVKITQSAYDALATKDSNTLYVIVD